MISEPKKSRKISFPVFCAIVAISYCLVFITAEFWNSPVSGLKGFLTLSMQWVVVAVPAACIVALLTLNRWLFFLYPIVIVLSAVAAYFKLTMGASITPAVIELAMINNAVTWFTLVSPMLIMLMILSAVLSIAVVFCRFKYTDNPHRWPVWAICLISGAVIPVHIHRFKAPIEARMPYSFVRSFQGWLSNRKAVAECRDTFNNVPATCPDDSLTVIFIIGESLRPDHLTLNGYSRLTTPSLSSDTAVVSLPDMRTIPFFTHTSVPRIMTRADSLHPDLADEEQSFITLFKKAGYRTVWLSNQDEVQSYSYFMHEADELLRINAGRTFYDYGLQLDEDLLPPLDQFLSSDAPRKLAVIHSIGSHWWYRSHYRPENALFKPEIDSRIISELSTEQMVNSYDNTILATDAFVNEIITRLRDKNAIIIFISDHGEALGENGKFLHGGDFPELHSTACFVWYSPIYAMRYKDKIARLKENASKRYMTDVMFHSALDAAAITTPALDGDMSIFR